MARDDERLKRTLERLDKRDRMEQKLGIDRPMTKLRDERASRTVVVLCQDLAQNKMRSSTS